MKRRGSFPDKGKPAARWGRKALDQVMCLIAGLPKEGRLTAPREHLVFGPKHGEATMFSGNRSLASDLCRALFVACALTVLCSLAPALSSAAQVTLAWDPNI